MVLDAMVSVVRLGEEDNICIATCQYLASDPMLEHYAMYLWWENINMKSDPINSA